MKHTTSKFHLGLLFVALALGVSFWVTLFSRSFAQLGPLGTQVLGSITSGLPTVNAPIITSPYVLDTANIKKNVINNTWNIPYNVPPNTNSTNFILQINGTTLNGMPQAQMLNGQLVFRVPDGSFGPLGSAMIGLAQKNPFKVVALNSVLVLAQGLQPSPFIFNQAALTQNSDLTWNIGYYIPPNTVAANYRLTIDSNQPLVGSVAYGGLIFKVPESWFTSGSVLTLILTDITTGKIVAVNVAFVPVSGPSPYVLDQTSIQQNQDGTWNIAYATPASTIANQFSVTPGNAPLVANGAIVSGKLVFKLPEGALTPGASVTLVLKNETTGQVRATNTITVPGGLPSQFILNFPPIQNQDQSWRVSYQIPPETKATDFVLLVGSDNQISGGIIVGNTLVFKVPQNLFAMVNTANVFVLKDKTSGKLYHSDGTVTQGAPDAVQPDTASYMGGLIISFPPEGQDIQQTKATIKANVHAIMDLPYVDSSYIWNKKDGDPANNTEKQLLKVLGPIGMKQGTDQVVTMTFTGLTPGQIYTFVIKNKVTNTLSDIVQFKTPTSANEKSYLTYTDGYIDYTPNPNTGDPNPVGPVVDDISDKGIVPLCGRTWTEGSGLDKNDKQFQPCGYSDFLQLISNIMRYALIIFGPIVAIFACITGFQIIWLGRIPDPTSEQMQALRNAKGRMVKIAVALLIILSGWVLIATITRELGVKAEYSLLDLFTGN